MIHQRTNVLHSQVHQHSPGCGAVLTLALMCMLHGSLQVPGGYLSSNLGGHKMLPPSVALWSVITALLPFAATSSMPALCATRWVEKGVNRYSRASGSRVHLLASLAHPRHPCHPNSLTFQGLYPTPAACPNHTYVCTHVLLQGAHRRGRSICALRHH